MQGEYGKRLLHLEDKLEKGEGKMAEIELSKINNEVKDDFCGLVLREEKKYHARINEVAEYVVNNDIRVLLLAGPSGSGKTTTANLISDRVKELGDESMVVSLDDFYRNSDDPDYPRLESGERDFECPDALKLSEVRDVIYKISKGVSFEIPKYSFRAGARSYVKTYDAKPHSCVIIEGLHALNPKLCEEIDLERVLKLFVSVSTNVNVEGERLISGRKARFVRRMVRDSIYRSADARKTLDMWENVISAEDVYLYPYKKCADMVFDTFHLFEFSVMKSFVEKLISEELAGENAYAGTVLSAMKRICGKSSEQVPDDSLIREFLPGGKYEHLY